jgi:hypothetical protein
MTDTITDAAEPLINPAPHQMAQLDFLLGEYRGLSSEVPGEGRMRFIMRTHKILDGNFYRMEIDIPTNTDTGVVHGFWDFGWDSVNLQYVAQYTDNLGSYGTGFSQGWQDGHFRLEGRYLRVIDAGGTKGVSTGEWVTTTDDFSIPSPGKLLDTVTYMKDGEWEPSGTLELEQVAPYVE